MSEHNPDHEKLRPGDRVIVRDDRGKEAEYKVKAAPWQLGHGKWVIGLAGISGGYSLGRVIRVTHREQTACDLCGDQGPLLLKSKCHMTAPLQAVLDGEILILKCYVPECGREVARFTVIR